MTFWYLCPIYEFLFFRPIGGCYIFAHGCSLSLSLSFSPGPWVVSQIDDGRKDFGTSGCIKMQNTAVTRSACVHGVCFCSAAILCVLAPGSPLSKHRLLCRLMAALRSLRLFVSLCLNLLLLPVLLHYVCLCLAHFPLCYRIALPISNSSWSSSLLLPPLLLFCDLGTSLSRSISPGLWTLLFFYPHFPSFFSFSYFLWYKKKPGRN